MRRTSMMIVLGIALAAAACDGPVQMTLQLPATMSSIDTSCVDSVQVATIGMNYAQDPSDFKLACIDLPMSEPTLADVQEALHGLVSLPIPDSGLASVAVYANGTSCAALPGTTDAPITADLIFYAGAPYDGGPITLTMVPNLSCKTSTVSVALVEMLELGNSHTCSTSLVPNSTDANVVLGTMSTNPVEPGVMFSGGLAGADLDDGIATVANARAGVAPGACFAMWGGDDSQDGMSCAVGAPPACASAGQYELATLPFATAMQTLDGTLQAHFGPPTFGLVYSGSGATGAPVAGATVTFEGSGGSVTYLDNTAAAAAGNGPLTKLTTTSTSASGMFVFYGTGFHKLSVSQGESSVDVVIGAQVTDPGTAIIRLQ